MSLAAVNQINVINEAMISCKNFKIYVIKSLNCFENVNIEKHPFSMILMSIYNTIH